MKKFCLLFVLMFSCLFFVGCGEFEYPNNVSEYNMNLSFNEQNYTLTGDLSINYINTSETTLNELKFHLYPNAFKENSKADVVSLANYEKAYPNGKSYGNITVSDVMLEQKVCQYSIGGEDENILIVSLDEELFPDSYVNISIKFETQLANINHRLGYGKNCINLCNFYPIACVYENGDFMTKLYNSNGDPFYSVVANYAVTFECDDNFIVASSGNQTVISQNGRKKVSINAKGVRDFAIVLSDKFETKSINCDDVELKYYYYQDSCVEDNVKIIEQCFKFFNQKIGKYPYNQLSIVKTNFVHGGMEYPNIVLISDDLTDNSTYQTVIVHEMCHQWWYGVVGNNQFDYGWIDEGLTEYSTALFFDNHEEYNKTSSQIVKSATTSYSTFMKVYSDVLGSVDTSMNRALDEFNTEPEYVYNTYTKGMLMFSTIKEIVGTDKFYKCLQKYYKKYAFSEVTPSEMIECFSKASGQDLENLFNSWIEGKVVIVGAI